MPLDTVAKKLNLYEPAKIISPKGIGARVYANLVKEKIGKVLERQKRVIVETGILVANPDSDQETQHPIAIICDFARQITEDELTLTHQLCWNFCRAPLLIVIEPTLVRAFSCYESPILQNRLSLLEGNSDDKVFHHPEPIKEFEINGDKRLSKESKAAIESLQWVELVSGSFFSKEKQYFPREQRADKTLLANLQYIREKLHKEGLEHDTIHDLLARLIFIQFLFQREDSEGKTAISADYLNKLYEEKKFSNQHQSLPEILGNYNDAYKFFRLLNDKFNGDLFPGNKEEAWQEEKAKVKKKHLEILADFVSGKIQQQTGQNFLWQIYSFDTIPLEFISSIYEEFVSQDQNAERGKKKQSPKKRETGVYYTKSHLVDFILDGVLPWGKPGDKSEWDLKILDPSCGSGIFLVKAFQRLVQRWKNQQQEESNGSNNQKRDSENLLRLLTDLLEKNLFGVDIDPHAVRVASFSLYLAMCDEIDPRTLWQKATFPNLRDEQIVARDFFDDDANNPLFKQSPDIKYDLIIGNAPWGRGTLKESEHAQKWANDNGWETSNNDIGTLFLPKAISVAKETAFISLVQPALPILTAQLSTAEKFRRQLFKKYKIEEIVNLSDLRFVLFEKAVSPPCIIIMRAFPPDGEPISYICPKKRGTDEDYRRIVIEPMDVSFVKLDEAVNEPWIWSALMWGNRRDVSLISRLFQYPTIQTLLAEKKIQKRRGIYRSSGQGERLDEILDRLILETPDFPSNTFLKLYAKEELEPNQNPYISEGTSTILNTFKPSQVFLKLGWTQENQRFQAAYVENSGEEGVLCSSAYFNIQSEQVDLLKSITLTYNSRFATYYLLLTNGRFAFYRPEPSGESFWQVPIPTILEKHFEELQTLNKKDRAAALKKLDKIVLNALGLNESEKLLVDDLFNYTLPDFKGKENSAGRLATRRKDKSELEDYCETFIKVIEAGFGQDKNIRATIFQESEVNFLPIRMIAIHLEYPRREKLIEIDRCDNETLWERLKMLNANFMQNQSENGNIFYQRVARIYQNMEIEGKQIPTIYLIKPDQKRYWLRSQALHDADEVSADIVFWNQQQSLAADSNRNSEREARQKKVA